MISIPSLPATPAVPKAAPQQPAAATSAPSDNDPNSFASYLKSLQNRQPAEETNGTSTPKLSLAVKDKADKDPKKSNDDKKSSLLTDTTPVPVTTTQASEPKSFQLSWLQAKGDERSSKQSAGSAGGAAAQDPGDSQDLKSSALKGSVAEAVANAPVAFGANLSKADVLKADGIKASDTKADAKANAAETVPGKSAAEVSKTAESKNSSGNQQQHSDSSHDDQPSTGGPAVKAMGASASTHAESPAAIHAAASPAFNQVPVGAATVQNAYAPSHTPSMDKAAPAAATTAVSEPAETPSVRPQNIDLKIPGADNSQVDVRVSQRAGDVQVTVRTPDGDLAQSLRQHLPELSDRLSQAGVSGDLWQPQSAQAANTGGNDADSRYSDDAQTQQQNQQQHSRNSNSNQGGQQQDGDGPQSAWLNELNKANKDSH